MRARELVRGIAVGIGGLLAHPALAQSTPEDQTAMLAAIVANGCVISDATEDAILVASGLTKERAGAALFALAEAGEADGTMTKDEAHDALVFEVEGCPK